MLLIKSKFTPCFFQSRKIRRQRFNVHGPLNKTTGVGTSRDDVNLFECSVSEDMAQEDILETIIDDDDDVNIIYVKG